MPLKRRVPKRGFTNIFRTEYRTVNVDRLNELPAGSQVTPEFLQKAGLLRKGTRPVKILGNGDADGRARRCAPTSTPAARCRRSRRPAARPR